MKRNQELQTLIFGFWLSPAELANEEGLALLCELNGQLDAAIAHRQREIELMERLKKEALKPTVAESTRTFMLRDRDETAIRVRRTILDGLQELKARRAGPSATGESTRIPSAVGLANFRVHKR